MGFYAKLETAEKCQKSVKKVPTQTVKKVPTANCQKLQKKAQKEPTQNAQKSVEICQNCDVPFAHLW